MKESTIESYLVRRCKELGVLCYKFVSPSHRGVPDRLLIFPHGLVAFIELKAPGKSPTVLQLAVLKQMEGNKAVIGWTDSKAGVDGHLLAWGDLDNGDRKLRAPAENDGFGPRSDLFAPTK